MGTKKPVCLYEGELKELQAGDTLGASSNASQLQGRDVSDGAPSGGQALVWDAAASQWIPATVSAAADFDEIQAMK